MGVEDAPRMQPPPTYNIPIACLVVGCLFAWRQLHSIVANNRIEVTSLFVTPGALLLGVIGLINPIIPPSLQPSATGYPAYAKAITSGCWFVSAMVGGVLYWLLV